MSTTWQGDDDPVPPPITAPGALLALLRGLGVVLVLVAGVTLHSLLRLAETALMGQRRPWSSWVVRGVSAGLLGVLGLRVTAQGQPMRARGAIVANHSSWLDIFVLNARAPVVFVAKSEVARWPGIGFLARIAGTAFIRRNPRDAGAQRAVFEERLHAGQHLCFFPEGTSTDGRRVLPFKSTLFAAFFHPVLRESMRIQPVSVIYRGPEGHDPRHYAWWGDMDFGPHALQVLATRRQGRVEVIYHPPLAVADFADRKALATAAGARVRAGVEGALGLSG